MNRKTEENIRVKNQIAFAYLDLLNTSSADEAEMITISQITAKANVSRMAYYRNFKSKTDIINYYLSETLWKELEANLSVNFNFWSVNYVTEFFQLMKKHKTDILLLKKHGYADLILSVFNSLNENLIGDMKCSSIERFKIYYAAGASYNAALHWLENGCHESPEDLAINISAFFHLNVST